MIKIGRYYSGDIEGKFWFGIQSSDDASYFGSRSGVEPSEPCCLEYYFEKENLPSVKEGIDRCHKALGDNKEKLDEFFKTRDYYNDKELAEYLETTIAKAKSLLKWYARLQLGDKILKCLEEQEQCSFTAEL